GEERRDQARGIEETVSGMERASSDALGPDEGNQGGDLGRLEPSGRDAEAALEFDRVAQPAFARIHSRQQEVTGLMEAQAPDGPVERLQLADREPREGDVDLGRELRPDAAVGERRRASAGHLRWFE